MFQKSKSTKTPWAEMGPIKGLNVLSIRRTVQNLYQIDDFCCSLVYSLSLQSQIFLFWEHFRLVPSLWTTEMLLFLNYGNTEGITRKSIEKFYFVSIPLCKQLKYYERIRELLLRPNYRVTQKKFHLVIFYRKQPNLPKIAL